MQFIRKEASALAESNSADRTTRRLRSADDAQDVAVNTLRDGRRSAFQAYRAFQSADLKRKKKKLYDKQKQVLDASPKFKKEILLFSIGILKF